MPDNGEINERFGVYKSVCCGREIIIREGATFPDCPNHPKLGTLKSRRRLNLILPPKLRFSNHRQ